MLLLRPLALAVLAALVTFTRADIGKTTYFGTQPATYYAFMHQYFNVADNKVADGATCGDEPTCVCWAKLCLLETATQSCSGPRDNFQMHVVDATKRPSGPLNISAYESAFAAKVGNFTGDFDPFWDYSFAYSTSDLDHFVTSLKAGGVPTLAFSWTSTTGAKMYSVLLHVPSTIALIELQGSALSAASPAFHLETPRFTPTAGQPAWEAPDAPAAADAIPFLKPVRISYASSDLERDAAFYTGVLGATQHATFAAPANGGNAAATTKVFTVKSGDAVQVHLTARPGAATKGELTVASFEANLNAAHATSLGFSDHTQGMDKPCDFHWGHADYGSLDGPVKAMAAMGVSAPKYRWFTAGGRRRLGGAAPVDDDEAGGTMYFIYIAQPNGACAQLIGTSTLAPTNLTGYDFCAGI